jgi:hypothetical protein
MSSQPEVREQMFKLIEQWQQSSLTQNVFCSQQSIRYHVFHYWYKRHRRLLFSSFHPIINEVSSNIAELKRLSILFYNGYGILNKTDTRADGVKQLLFKDPDVYCLKVNDATQ